MLFLTLALLSTAPTCTDVQQQCRACPTKGSVQGCSSVGIACQPHRRICEPASPVKESVRPDTRSGDKKSR